jgi:hypothetical protein
MSQRESGAGWSLLDGAAVVMGSAVASTHLLRMLGDGLSTAGWIMAAVTFSWIALTASGPFIYLARKYVRKIDGYPGVGDRLWTLLGMPWIISGVLDSMSPSLKWAQGSTFAFMLSVGLAIACPIALGVIWSNWVMVPPEQARRIEAGPWTNRVGLFLAIAWPVQCGLGMIVLS